MTAASPAIAPERELEGLYARSKALTLATAAALMLESDLGELAAEAEQLLEDSLAAHRRMSSLRPQLSACIDAAQGLRRLLVAAVRGDAADVDLERARASHRRLRREVWRVLPCEYVPCCASGHAHAER